MPSRFGMMAFCKCGLRMRDVDYCKCCGHPKSDHPFRHPFVPGGKPPGDSESEPKRRLLALVDTLEPDAIEALLCVAVRLKKGQDYYGNLNLDTDTRDFAKEREEELQDALVYSAFVSIRYSFVV